MPYFIDYKEEVKRLLAETYVPADMVSKEFELSTADILRYLQNILPEKSVDDHMVYEALLELGYHPKERTPLEFYWYFKRNDMVD